MYFVCIIPFLLVLELAGGIRPCSKSVEPGLYYGLVNVVMASFGNDMSVSMMIAIKDGSHGLSLGWVVVSTADRVL